MKTETERLQELELALVAMANGAKHFREAKDPSYLLGIATQLRALVCFNEKKPANSKPLLLTLADEAGVSLKLHSYPPKEVEAGHGWTCLRDADLVV